MHGRKPAGKLVLSGCKHSTPMPFLIKRIYEPPDPQDGFRVLVDRIWPRGLRKEETALQLWARELAPSAALRRWFGHDPARWQEFRSRYRLEIEEQAEACLPLLEQGRRGTVTLLYAARDPERNNAVVLAEWLNERLHTDPMAAP